MKFLTNSHGGGYPNDPFAGEQTAPQALLIGLGLIYLAIPNLLFLWGWFVPWVAILVSALILFAVGRAVVVLFQASSPFVKPRRRRVVALAAGVLVALLVIFHPIVHAGLLGLRPAYGDIWILRQGMFCNLRDAAWPVILPNGKEMSYYIAGVLPAAASARLAPAISPWFVAAWAALPALLALLMLSSFTSPSSSRKWGVRLALLAIFMAVFGSPLSIVSSTSYPKVAIRLLEGITGLGWSCLLPHHVLTTGGAIAVGALYNSAPAVLLVTAITISCRRREEVVLPVALSLLVPISPFGSLALLPLVAVRLIAWLKKRGARNIASLCREMILPSAMFFVSVIYFTRGDGANAFTLTGVAWGWGDFLHQDAWLAAGWVVMVLPLFFVVRKDAFFLTLLGCYLLLPFVFIGTMPEPGMGRNNELWLKASPCYAAVVAFYWLQHWRHIGWYKYVILLLCLGTKARVVVNDVRLFGSREYLQVDDRWNGHLNHDDPFLNQSVPPCKEPLVPGVMLREAGESEAHFPGCLLPKAPGCDYSRPANAPTR